MSTPAEMAAIEIFRGMSNEYDNEDVKNAAYFIDEAIKTETHRLKDVLDRVDRILRDAILIESSPAAWDCVELTSSGNEYQVATEPYCHSTGPVWKGKPGEHPLLSMLRQARKPAPGSENATDPPAG